MASESLQLVETSNEKLPLALVVDDDSTNRLVLSTLLNRSGYDVDTAKNGQEAVDQFERRRPDIIFMDVMMPVMDGYEATRIIKTNSKDFFVPVIFLTAMTDDDDLANCISAGGDDFLTKPINHIILNAKIKAAERLRDMYRTVYSQHARLIRDEEVAEQLFSRVVEVDNIKSPGLHFFRQSADVFSGDIFLTAYSPSGTLYIMLGDFTGHGLSAALGALPTSELFHSLTEKGHKPTEIIAAINRKLHHILPTGLFLAAVFVAIDIKKRAFTVWNGGMPNVIVYNKNGEIKSSVPSNHLALGILPDIDKNHVQWIPTESENSLLVYTDGLVEMNNPQGEMFGEHRVHKLLNSCVSNEIAISLLEESIASFSQCNKQDDDISFTLLDFDLIAGNEQLFESEPQLENNKAADIKQSSLDDGENIQKLWSWSFDINSETLKKIDVVPFVLDHLENLYGLEAHRNKLFTIISELFNNALDHGILKLDSSLKSSANGFSEYMQLRDKRLSNLESGSINLNFECQRSVHGTFMYIDIKDSGLGFKYEKYNQSIQMSENQYSGRGVMLVKGLCQSVEYCGTGNHIKVTYVCDEK